MCGRDVPWSSLLRQEGGHPKAQTLQCLPIKYKLLTVYKALGRLASFIFDSLLLMHWAPVILDYLVLVPMSMK